MKKEKRQLGYRQNWFCGAINDCLMLAKSCIKSDPEYYGTCSFCASLLDESVKFFVPDRHIFTCQQEINYSNFTDLIDLPFQNTSISNEKEQVIVCATSNGEGKDALISMVAWFKGRGTKKRWIFCPYVYEFGTHENLFGVNEKGENCIVVKPNASAVPDMWINEPDLMESITGRLDDYFWILLESIVLMNVENKIIHKTKIPTQLNKKRIKKGKQPFYDFWILEIPGTTQEIREMQGGTHASPRFHLRRGHPRRLKSGKAIWVRPHSVGHKELGFVEKEYNLVRR